MTTPDQRADSIFYRQFMNQMNEHKAMLIAVGLLIYAVAKVTERW